MLSALRLFVAINSSRLIASLPPGRLFAFMFNLRAVLLFSQARVAWTGSNYVTTDRKLPGYRRQFAPQGHAYFLYIYGRGFKRAVDDMICRRLLQHVKFAKGDIVLDCGAQVGDLKLALDAMGARVRYIGFEPDPIVFPCLKHNTDRKNSPPNKEAGEAHNVGLWHKKAILPFYLSTRDADSGFIKPKTYTEIIRIPTLPLSQFIKGRVKLLKLEAEGAELEVLQGAGNKIRMVEYISADLGAERGVDEEYTFVPVTNYLTKHGFETVALWIGDKKSISVLFHNSKMQNSLVKN